jgi:hypothetical protein
VQALAYMPTDYPPEAAYCALLEWLREVLDVDVPALEIRFDSASRRYVVTRRQQRRTVCGRSARSVVGA